jgi:hypothetical protein
MGVGFPGGLFWTDLLVLVSDEMCFSLGVSFANLWLGETYLLFPPS